MVAEAPARKYTYRRRHRLSGSRSYAAVFGARVSTRKGPLIVFARPNGLDHARLGLSIGRKVGNAVRRNAIKRRLREAFRHLQHELDRGYDLVVSARPHEPMPAQEYARLLEGASRDLARTWARRERRRRDA